MKSSNQNNESILCITGLTKRQLDEEIAISKLTGNRSKNACYICRRKADETAIAFDPGTEEIMGQTIKIDFVIRKHGDKLLFFEICQECQLLFGINETMPAGFRSSIAGRIYENPSQ